MAPLWLGKMSLRDVSLVSDLAEREILLPPKLVPHYIEDDSAKERLKTVAAGEDLTGLIEGTL